MLLQTAAAVLVPLVFKALSAAAAAELGRSTVQSAASITARQGVPAAIVSMKVIGQTKGMLRTMMPTKFKIATAVVLVAVAVVSARGIVLPELVLVAGHPQPAKAASPAIDNGGKSNGEPKKAPDEPAWKKEFREKYGLKEGESVKRIAPPYPPCRSDYLADRLAGSDDPTKSEEYFSVLRWKDGWAPAKLARRVLFVKPEQGIRVGLLLNLATGIPGTRIEGLELLDDNVTGDFVVRDGATPDQIVTQLETILKRQCDLSFSFRFKDAEQDVFVLEGKYEAKPLDGRKKNEIEVYAKHLFDGNTGELGEESVSATGTFDEFVAQLEGHVRIPVLVDKIEGLPKKVSWRTSDHTPAAMVLDNIASQTGLTVKTEKRKVRVLVVERAKADK